MNTGDSASRDWRGYLPVLRWAPSYQRAWWKGDVAAGLVVAALAVPQALGYAAIAGVPVEVGLYAVPTALLAYAVFGTSPQLVVGPVSTVSILSGSLVKVLAPDDEAQAIAYTVGLALGAGLVLVLAGLLRIGWVAEFLSKPIVTGFVFGLTVIVIIGEIPKMVGVSVPSGTVFTKLGALFTSIGTMNGLTMAISIASLAVLFGLGARWPKVPWSLLLLVVAILVSEAAGLADRGVAVVGEVPGGLPLPGLPAIPLADLGRVLVYGGALALVGIAEGLSAARLFAVKGRYRVDADQELVATGAANLAAGLFGGLGVAGSLSKTAAAEGAGARSQVAGVTTALAALLVVLVLAPALSALPLAVLAAVVVKAVWGLMDRRALQRYREVRRLDFVAAMTALIATLLFGPLTGLGIAIGLSVLGLVYRSSVVRIEAMGRIAGEKAAWGSLRHHPERRVVPGIVVLRLDAPMFWVNALACQDGMLAAVLDEEARTGEATTVVVIDLEGTNALDTTSADSLAELVNAMHDRGTDVYLARVRFQVRTLLRRSGVMALVGEDHVWHSISQAVRQARREHGITADLRCIDEGDGSKRRVPASGEDEFGHLWSPFVP
jgi:high affinity sulfate transporter 1